MIAALDSAHPQNCSQSIKKAILECADTDDVKKNSVRGKLVVINLNSTMLSMLLVGKEGNRKAAQRRLVGAGGVKLIC